MVKRKPKPLLFIIIILIVLVLLVASGFLTWNYLSGPVDKNDSDEIEFVVKDGMSSSKIGHMLKEKDLIHNELVFKVYLKLNKINSLKAATYIFYKDMSLAEIVKNLEKGSNYNPNQIRITFKEGLRITDYAKVVEEETNHTANEFIEKVKDKEYLEKLIEEYWFLTEDILNKDIYYPLEGYLFPETYYFDNKDVEITDIIETMLKQMNKVLETYKRKISEKPHYYLTMASMAELEGTNSENKEMIVGIFENRLTARMNLGSDVTTYYSLQLPMTSNLTKEQFDTVNAYNTRSDTMIGKMPAGPICNPGKGSIAASVNPTKSNYYYFVADKNGKIYYTKTNAEHNKKIDEIKAKGDWIW